MIEIELVFANAPHQIERETLLLPVGVTVSEACAASALATRLGFGSAVDRDGGAHAPLGLGQGLGLGLWGGLCGPDTVLQPHDRLTLLRPLQADPMEARRQRLRRDGMRKAKPPPRGVRGP